MEIKYKSNLTGGIVCIICGLILAFIVPREIAEDLVKTDMSSRTIPYVVAAILTVCGIILTVESLILKKDEVKILKVNQELKALLYIVLLGVYSFALKQSFLISTSVLTVVTLAFTKCKKPLYYVISLIVVFVLYYVFKELLNVRLP